MLWELVRANVHHFNLLGVLYQFPFGMPGCLALRFVFRIKPRQSERAKKPRLFNDAIALAFAAGVFHVTLSTPGVFLPLFSVTRFTANARPLNEWVSSHCRAFTLLWRPACTAFTIRVCSPLTWR